VLLCSAAFISATAGAQPFILTSDRAFQASFPTLEGYEYQLFYSSDLMNWTPASDRIVGCGNTEMFTFKTTNSSAFYRGQEFPPDLTRRFVGLTNVFLGTASLTSTQGGPLMVQGMRIQSRDYTFNDYVTATYQLDFCKQSFLPTQVQVFTNVGITTKPGDTTFFFKDITDSICITNAAAPAIYCTQDNPYTLSSTGQVLSVGLQAGQLFSVKTTTSTSTSSYRYIVTDPAGNQIYNYGPVPAATTFTFGAFQAILSGRYSIQFLPISAASFSMTLRFVNTNNRVTRTLVNGAMYSSSLRNYSYDYDKFQITLSAGQTLSVSLTGTGPVTGTALTVYNSLGVYQSGIGNSASFTFQPTINDTYYLIFYNSDSAVHSNTLTPSIF